jgi:hypothetical protein
MFRRWGQLGQGPPLTGPSFTERDVAQLLLLVGGLLLVVPGGWLLLSGPGHLQDCTGSQYQFQCSLGRLFFTIACVMIVVGAAHFVAMIGVRRRRRSADWLATALAVTWIVWVFWVPTLLGVMLSP